MERTGVPVASTLMGLGTFPGTDPLALQMLGMHGTVFANYSVDQVRGLYGHTRAEGLPGKREQTRARACVVCGTTLGMHGSVHANYSVGQSCAWGHGG